MVRSACGRARTGDDTLEHALFAFHASHCGWRTAWSAFAERFVGCMLESLAMSLELPARRLATTWEMPRVLAFGCRTYHQ